MVYLLAAACGYAAIITVLFLIMCACTEENEALHNTEVERLSLELYQSRSILMDTQDMYNKRIKKLLAEIKFQNEIIDNLQKNDDALYDEHRHKVLSLEEKNRDLQRKVLSLEDENMNLRLALIEMKDVK